MSVEILSINQMLSNEYEPKLGFRWYLDINGVSAFLMESVTKPQMNFEEVMIPFINNVRFVAGRMTPQPMTLVIKEAVAPSAAQQVMNWIRLCYEVETGRMGYSEMYKKDLVLKGLDAVGAVVERWLVKGAFVQTSNFGEFSYETGNAQVKVNITLRYDRAVLEY